MPRTQAQWAVTPGQSAVLYDVTDPLGYAVIAARHGLRAVPSFESAISQAIFHSEDLRENLMALVP
jgi:hypothetical protein